MSRDHDAAFAALASNNLVDTAATIIRMMDLVFCATPQFAVPTLERLVADGFRVQLVVTQPDRPSGRGMAIALSPVKTKALELGLPIAQPEKIKVNPGFRAQLESIAPEAIVVVGYGRIIPQWMLDLPPLGNINLHASLLPKYRGAAPIQWAIANGETVTGNTTMRINAGLDTGDIICQQEIAIQPDYTAETLSDRLAQSGSTLMVETLRALHDGSAKLKPQDNRLASFAPILKKDDGQIDFSLTAREISNRLRGFHPWPGAFTTFRGKNISVISAKPSVEDLSVSPGQLIVRGDRVFVGCGGHSLLEIEQLRPEGKQLITGRDFANGYRPRPDERLGGAE